MKKKSPLLLGKCEVEFEHEYVPVHVTSKKDGKTTVCRSPIATTVTIVTPKGETLFARVAKHYKDPFVFETGRKKALKKALSFATTMPKADRKRFWDEYSKTKPGGRW